MKVKSGFSLIEIMIAVVIIGIMATIGISAISGYRARASKTATVSMLTSLKMLYKCIIVIQENIHNR